MNRIVCSPEPFSCSEAGARNRVAGSRTEFKYSQIHAEDNDRIYRCCSTECWRNHFARVACLLLLPPRWAGDGGARESPHSRRRHSTGKCPCSCIQPGGVLLQSDALLAPWICAGVATLGSIGLTFL